MFPFAMSLSDKIDFLNTGRTVYASVGSNSTSSNNKPSSAGLCYSQGYMNGSSSTTGINNLKSGNFGAKLGHIGYCTSTGNLNSYNNGFLNGAKNR